MRCWAAHSGGERRATYDHARITACRVSVCAPRSDRRLIALLALSQTFLADTFSLATRVFARSRVPNPAFSKGARTMEVRIRTFREVISINTNLLKDNQCL